MRTPERLEVEALLRPGPAGHAEPPTKRRVVREALERRGKELRVARVDEETGLALDDLLGDPADARRDDWEPGSHRFENGDRVAFGAACQHEDVGGRQEAWHVVALPRESHGVGEAAGSNRLLQLGAVRPVADDHRLERSARQATERSDERLEVLWRLQPADGDEKRRLAGGDRARRRSDIDGVRDHDSRVTGARAGREPGFELALGDADRRRRQRPHQPVCNAVGASGKARVGGECPPVRREDPDRNAADRRREPAEHAGLGAVRVEDVRPLAAQETDQLDEACEVAKRIDLAPHVLQRNEVRACLLGRAAQRTVAVCGHRHVEARDERRQQRRDVRLRAADLGERDEHQQARAGG